MLPFADYEGREQTYVKHFVLSRYLERLAYKVGRRYDYINYIDGFAGPWRHENDSLEDTSPHIACAELLKARSGILRTKAKAFHPRCLFIESDPLAHHRLVQQFGSREDVEVLALHGKFEESIDRALEFVAAKNSAFSFIFIDPTGWTGYGLDLITPLLKCDHSEVLINFMTQHIQRFIEHPDPKLQATFVDLYGRAAELKPWQELSGPDREDAIVDAYCARIREAGGFRFATAAVVLNPRADRTHFHLVYGTRSLHGLRVFRDVETKAMQRQEEARDHVRARRREAESNQASLFEPAAVSSPHLSRLHQRYAGPAKAKVLEYIRTNRRLQFEQLEEVALQHRMTATSELKDWLRQWRDQGRIEYEGLGPKEQVPKHGRHNFVRWTGR